MFGRGLMFCSPELLEQCLNTAVRISLPLYLNVKIRFNLLMRLIKLCYQKNQISFFVRIFIFQNQYLCGS